MTIGVETRALMAIIALVAIGIIPTWEQLAANLAALLILATSTGALNRLVKGLWPCASLLAAMFIIHGLFNPANQHYWWVLGLEGTGYALRLALRLLCILIILHYLISTTPPLEFVKLFNKIHPDLGMIVSMFFAIMPSLQKQFITTLEIQEVRGLVKTNSLPARLRAYLAVLIPIVLNSINNAYGLAQLLYLRGYSGRHIEPAREPAKRSEKVALGLSAVYLLANMLMASRWH
ncbi:ABC-type cobalt transport system, permease component CbiQ and related transporters [Moorella thermoacetica Y72]|uniref:ABC-type cobalt transport system, permease component CbiQ and related transporters n=1 Tax=Moorella thermoacetica Y72 TaxID=1325331 RepID=A0A0S6UAG7_NEOTH|nr:energy-coupling factor transporter transmembrane component T [Moorella thermoacetica]GAF25268.1 ABC-type cobalt transport system, permease component CbiQ and related transporters [Moorella thermoacetica Y72]